MNAPAVFFAAILGFAQIPLPRFIFERDALIAGEKGYLIGPAHCFAGPGEIRQLIWSSDGRLITALTESVEDRDRMKALRGESVPLNCSITVYDVQTQTTTVTKTDPSVGALLIHGWMGNTQTLLYSWAKVLPSGPQRNEPEMEWRLFRWTPGAGQAQSVLTAKAPLNVYMSSKQPYAIVQGYDEPFMRPTAAVVREAGSAPPVRPPLKTYLLGKAGMASSLSDPERFNGDILGEDNDGYFVECVMRFEGRKQVSESYSRIGVDGKTTPTKPGVVRDIRGLQDHFSIGSPQSRDPNGLQIMLTRTDTKHAAATTRVQSGWIWMPDNGKIVATLIAAEVDRMLLSPTLSAVAFVSRDNVFVRKISEASASDLEAALEAVERKDLMDRAKQVGTGMMIYGADSDDLLPPAQDWQNRLLPYLKNRNLTDGFYYEMNGEDMSKLEDPAKKRMGYIEGRYGRAIVFADSHVIWERRKLP